MDDDGSDPSALKALFLTAGWTLSGIFFPEKATSRDIQTAIREPKIL
jgi:hypothetical protein